MRTDAQREASRKNGAKSHGPKTDQGKANSSHNSYRHGLTAKRSLSTTENSAVFVKHLEAYHEKFQPQDDVERNIVDAMALCHWRERRAWSKEATLIDIEMDRMSAKVDEKFGKVDHATRYALAFKNLCDKSNSMSLLIRYENSHRRDFHRKLLDLIEVRKDLLPPPPEPNEDSFDETNPGSETKQTKSDETEPENATEPESNESKEPTEGTTTTNEQRLGATSYELRATSYELRKAGTNNDERRTWTSHELRNTAAFLNTPASLIEVENMHNMGGGTVYPMDTLNEICDSAHELGLKVHLDGARIFNAAAYLNLPVSEIAREGG